MELEELLNLRHCDCGRYRCDFFGPGIGDYGASFSRETIEKMVEILPKVQQHLEELLSAQSKPIKGDTK